MMRLSRTLLFLPAAAACGGYNAPVTPTGDVTPPVVAASPAQLESTLFLIGDAGSPAENEPVFAALTKQVLATPAWALDANVLRRLEHAGAVERIRAYQELAVQRSRQVVARVVGPAGVSGVGMRPERRSQPQC